MTCRLPTNIKQTIRSYAIGGNVLLIGLLSSGKVIAQTTGKELLEQRIQGKLDRILTPEEYLIDIKEQAIGTNNATGASSDKFLPGLQILGPSPENDGPGMAHPMLQGKADVLIIFDKKVSKERARVAQDIVGRIIESEGLKASVKISAQQKDISKIPPKDVTPPTTKDPTLLDQLIREKDFIARAVLMFWGGLVSLMALYFVLRRLLLGGSGEDRVSSRNEGRGSNPPQPQDGSKPSLSSSPKAEKTREEIYSKDEAMLGTLNEIKIEAREQPKKVARILSKWVAQSDELARSASLFLRNCDIKTVELVCQVMHPSDLELIIAHRIEDFEPFSQENQRVIDRMRADFAVLASEQSLSERPDPLSFLKRLSDEDIRNVLHGESEEIIALVATQIPAHRLQKLYEHTSPEILKMIMAQLSSIRSATVGDFESVQSTLNQKMEHLAGNLVSEKDRTHSVHQMIAGVPSPVLQCELINRLHTDNKELFSKVRASTVVATDLRFLPSRVKSLLIQSIDADTFGTALSDFAVSFDALLDGLPQTYQSVFADAQSRHYEVGVVNAAWKRILSTLNELVAAGLISKNEVGAMIRRADLPISVSSASEASENDEGEGLSAA